MVGVTGSTGKTTTKELIATLLATRFTVHKSQGNLNNQYGLPLTLLALEPAHEVAVLEMGMSARGEIARLADRNRLSKFIPAADPDAELQLVVQAAARAVFRDFRIRRFALT